MADINTPMTPQDHVLCMAAVFLTAKVVEEPARQKMILDILSSVLPNCGDNPKVKAVALAARDVARDPRDIWADCQLKEALADWAEWRLGLAWDRLNREAAA